MWSKYFEALNTRKWRVRGKGSDGSEGAAHARGQCVQCGTTLFHIPVHTRRPQCGGVHGRDSRPLRVVTGGPLARQMQL